LYNEISDDEVICLDDDDDDDDDNHNHNDNNNNGNGNNLQSTENCINPLNHWVLPPPSPLLSRNNNTNNSVKTYQRKNKNNANQIITIKRYVMSLYIIYIININKLNLRRVFLLKIQKSNFSEQQCTIYKYLK